MMLLCMVYGGLEMGCGCTLWVLCCRCLHFFGYKDAMLFGMCILKQKKKYYCMKKQCTVWEQYGFSSLKWWSKV